MYCGIFSPVCYPCKISIWSLRTVQIKLEFLHSELDELLEDNDPTPDSSGSHAAERLATDSPAVHRRRRRRPRPVGVRPVV